MPEKVFTRLQKVSNAANRFGSNIADYSQNAKRVLNSVRDLTQPQADAINAINKNERLDEYAKLVFVKNVKDLLNMRDSKKIESILDNVDNYLKYVDKINKMIAYKTEDNTYRRVQFAARLADVINDDARSIEFDEMSKEILTGQFKNLIEIPINLSDVVTRNGMFNVSGKVSAESIHSGGKSRRKTKKSKKSKNGRRKSRRV